jgi:hypothetical protein
LERDWDRSALYPVLAIVVSVLALALLEPELRSTGVVESKAAVDSAAAAPPRFARAPVAPILAAHDIANPATVGIPVPRPRPDLAISSGS